MPLEEITRDLIREITHEYPKLESLNLSHNTIKEIKSLDLLPNLRKLDLSWNKIQYLPKDLGFQLQRLEYLNLSSNYICKLDHVDTLKTLRVLLLQNNKINRLNEIQKLQELQSLVELDLRGNLLAEQEAFRRHVIKLMPQLQILDGREISAAERRSSKIEIEKQHQSQSFSSSRLLTPQSLQNDQDRSNMTQKDREIFQELSPFSSDRTSFLQNDKDPKLLLTSILSKSIAPALKDISIPMDKMSLLENRVKALEKVISVQENALVDNLVLQNGAKDRSIPAASKLYHRLLSSWREHVFTLLLQIKFVEDSFYSRDQERVAKIKILEQANSVLDANCESLQQKAIDLEAQKSLEVIRVIEAERKASLAETKLLKAVQTLQVERSSLQRVVSLINSALVHEQFFDQIFHRLHAAANRLEGFEKRLLFAQDRIILIADFSRCREARTRNSEAALEVERRKWKQHVCEATIPANRKVSRRLVSRLSKRTEDALRILFHQKDVYNTGLVSSSALLLALQQDNRISNIIGSDEKRQRLVSYLRDQIYSSGKEKNISWGELLLQFVPNTENIHQELTELPPDFPLPHFTPSSKHLKSVPEVQLDHLSRNELLEELRRCRHDRAILQDRVRKDARELQERATSIRVQWEAKVDELLVLKNRADHELIKSQQIIQEERNNAQKVEMEHRQLKYQLDSLRKELCIQQADAARRLELADEQASQSLQKLKDELRVQLDDLRTQNSDLQKENALQKVKCTQLERDLTRKQLQSEECENAKIKHLEEKLISRDREISKLRRERNTVLSSLRNYERRSSAISAGSVMNVEKVKHATNRQQELTLQILADEKEVVDDNKMTLREIHSQFDRDRAVSEKLVQLESLTQSLLLEDSD